MMKVLFLDNLTYQVKLSRKRTFIISRLTLSFFSYFIHQSSCARVDITCPCGNCNLVHKPPPLFCQMLACTRWDICVGFYGSIVYNISVYFFILASHRFIIYVTCLQLQGPPVSHYLSFWWGSLYEVLHWARKVASLLLCHVSLLIDNSCLCRGGTYTIHTSRSTIIM